MNPKWRQKNPVDQFKAIRGSLAGHLDNFGENMIDAYKFNGYVHEHLKQLEELEPYLDGSKPWKIMLSAEEVEYKQHLDKAVLAALGYNDTYTVHLRIVDETVFFKLTNVEDGITGKEFSIKLDDWQHALLASLIS